MARTRFCKIISRVVIDLDARLRRKHIFELEIEFEKVIMLIPLSPG